MSRKRKLKIKFEQFIIRWKVVFKILLNPKSRWFVAFLTDQQLINLYKGDEFLIVFQYHRIQKDILIKMLRNLNESIDEWDELYYDIEASVKADEYKTTNGGTKNKNKS